MIHVSDVIVSNDFHTWSREIHVIFPDGILNSVPECYLFYPTWKASCIMRLLILIGQVENLLDVEELNPIEDEMRIGEMDSVESHS